MVLDIILTLSPLYQAPFLGNISHLTYTRLRDFLFCRLYLSEGDFFRAPSFPLDSTWYSPPPPPSLYTSLSPLSLIHFSLWSSHVYLQTSLCSTGVSLLSTVHRLFTDDDPVVHGSYTFGVFLSSPPRYHYPLLPR